MTEPRHIAIERRLRAEGWEVRSKPDPYLTLWKCGEHIARVPTYPADLTYDLDCDAAEMAVEHAAGRNWHDALREADRLRTEIARLRASVEIKTLKNKTVRYVIATGWRGDAKRAVKTSRGLTQPEEQKVRSALGNHDPDVVIEGGAPGVDVCAHTYAREFGLGVLTVPAPWKLHGKRAGPFRNKALMRIGSELQALGHFVTVLAFPKPGKSRGTYQAIEEAEKGRLQVEVHEL